MAVISFVGLKGGLGKSTAAVSCAAEYVRRGKRVLLVESDFESRSALLWDELAAENGRDRPTVVAMNSSLHHRGQLPALAGSYELVVVDTPPQNGEITKAVLSCSDVAVIPCGQSTFETARVLPTLELVKEQQRERRLQARLLICKKNPRTTLGQQLRELLESTGVPVFQSELCYRTDYQYAAAAGLGPTTYRPSSMAALEVRNLVNELEEICTAQSTFSRRKRQIA